MRELKATFALVVIAALFMSCHAVIGVSKYFGKAGCHEGSCWAGCLVLLRGSPSWCYTTSEGVSQNYKYVTCTEDSECNKDWKCAGPCF